MALWQIISHEYRKYVFTRGFLLFLLIIPVSVLFGAGASLLNAATQPVRAFTVIDQTGLYGEAVDSVLADRRARRALSAWDAYVTGLSVTREDAFDLPYPFDPDDEANAARRDAFAAAGGIAAANAALRSQLPEGTPPAEAPRETIVRVAPPDGVPTNDLVAAADALRPYLNGDRRLEGADGDATELFAALLIPADFGAEGAEAQFWTQNLADESIRGDLRRALTAALKRTAYKSEGLDQIVVRRIEAIRAPLATFKSDSETGEEAGAAEFLATYLPLGLAYILLVMIMSVGGMLLTSTVEEKSNKIVEVLLSSVTATQLMAGKLIGLMLVGVTAPLLFLTAGLIATAIGLTQVAPDGTAAEVLGGLWDVLFGSPLLPLFFLCFVLGYVLFASLYLAVGAMSESIQDAQSFVGPLTILLVLPLPFLGQAVQDPNGTVMRILTWVPIYTPYALMMRINNDPPFWEMAGALAMLVAFTGLVLFFMGRIYRNGVLSSGGAPKLKDAVKLARAG